MTGEINQPDANQPIKAIAIPDNWEMPTYTFLEVVWHNCRQWKVVGIAMSDQYDQWEYDLKADDGEEVWALEHQVSSERPDWCDQSQDDDPPPADELAGYSGQPGVDADAIEPTVYEQGSPSYPEASGVWN